MRITKNRDPKPYKINGTVFMIAPASKDDISKNYRESLYEMQNGDRVESDPHLFEMNLLNKFIRGWDDTLIDENDKPIPFNAGSLNRELSDMDQSDRDSIFSVIISPSRNRSKLVAAEKNA